MLMLAVGSGASLATAQSLFTIAAGTLAWSEPTHWTPEGVPNAVGASVEFGTPVGVQSVVLGGGITVGSVSFANDSTTTIEVASGASNILTFEVASGNASLNVGGTGNVINRFLNPVILNSDLAAHVTNTAVTDSRGAFAFFGSVSGTGRIIKTGPGMMSVAGGTYTFGGSSLLGGTYRITAHTGLGGTPTEYVADAVIIDGGRLQFANSVASTSSATRGFTLGSNNAEIAVTSTGGFSIIGPIVGPGQLTKTGTGTLTLSHQDTAYAGGTTVESGILRVGRNQSLGSGPVQLGVVGGGDATLVSYLSGWNIPNDITVLAGVTGLVTFGGTGTSNFNTIFSGLITVNGPLTVTSSDPVGYRLSLTGTLAGSGNITKVGPGEMRVFGANSWDGNLAISEGSAYFTTTSELRFTLQDGGVSNSVSGTGPVSFGGYFRIDPTGLSTTAGSWQLVDVTTLEESFLATFGLLLLGGETAFSDLGNGTFQQGGWVFDTGTGTLTLIPEPSLYAAALALMALGLVHLRRRRGAVTG